MIKQVFSIRDTKAEVYFPPFMYLTRAEALRIFQDMANDGQSMLSKHPEDYILFHVGQWDDSTCQYTQQSPQSLGLAVEYVKSIPVPFKKDE